MRLDDINPELEYEAGKNQNKLRDSDIATILKSSGHRRDS